MELNKIFNLKLTENGDIAFKKVSEKNPLLNILFLTEYYQKHLNEVPVLDDSDVNRLFAMFIRDPRYGLGRRDLGRRLMSMTSVAIDDIIKAGRVDDIFAIEYDSIEAFHTVLNYLRTEIVKGNELVKKWMPRYSSKYLQLARYIAHYWGMNKQQYGHFIKCNTTENKMSRRNYDELQFEHIPSLAMIKYAAAFARKPETKERYAQYLEDVKAGKKDLKISTTTVYDIYKNRTKIDADLFFSKIEKISGSWIPIVDTSGSMWDANDSIGKAFAIGHYLAKCSSYCPNQVISFSSNPKLLTLGNPIIQTDRYAMSWLDRTMGIPNDKTSQYEKEIRSMFTGDCSNTDFGKVMQLLSLLGDNMPEYLIVLSDQEFDMGSSSSKEATMKLFKSKGYTTKIVWWNFNSRHITCPEMDSDGNIFLSGYNPMLLKFLQAGFDGNQFLDSLLREYAKAIQE